MYACTHARISLSYTYLPGPLGDQVNIAEVAWKAEAYKANRVLVNDAVPSV